MKERKTTNHCFPKRHRHERCLRYKGTTCQSRCLREADFPRRGVSNIRGSNLCQILLRLSITKVVTSLRSRAGHNVIVAQAVTLVTDMLMFVRLCSSLPCSCVESKYDIKTQRLLENCLLVSRAKRARNGLRCT